MAPADDMAEVRELINQWDQEQVAQTPPDELTEDAAQDLQDVNYPGYEIVSLKCIDAEKATTVLNKIYDLNIETAKLIEEGKEIKAKMLELAEKAQQYQQQQLPTSSKKQYTQYFQ